MPNARDGPALYTSDSMQTFSVTRWAKTAKFRHMLVEFTVCTVIGSIPCPLLLPHLLRTSAVSPIGLMTVPADQLITTSEQGVQT